MAGENAALWQVQSGGNGLEATAGDTHTIDFNASTKVPSDGPFISDIKVNFRRAVPENEGVDVDNNELQDMGVDGLDITLEGVIGNADNDNTVNAVNKLAKWVGAETGAASGNTVAGFTKGRYGLRLDNAPQWNVVPSTTFGYHIRDIQLRYVGEKKDLVMFTINMSLGGDIPSAI